MFFVLWAIAKLQKTSSKKLFCAACATAINFPPLSRSQHGFTPLQETTAKTELRRRKRWHWIPIGPSEEEERSAFYEPVDKGQLPGEQTDTHQVTGKVVDAINQLPDEFREAVLLRDLNGLSYEEIGKIINCPVGTVKSRVNRGRLRLQKTLRNLAEEVIGTLSATA